MEAGTCLPAAGQLFPCFHSLCKHYNCIFLIIQFFVNFSKFRIILRHFPIVHISSINLLELCQTFLIILHTGKIHCLDKLPVIQRRDLAALDFGILQLHDLRIPVLYLCSVPQLIIGIKIGIIANQQIIKGGAKGFLIAFQ